MRSRRTILRVVAALAALVAAMPAARGGEPSTIDLAAVKKAAAPAVALVTVQNSLGLPVAYASGFLLGEGRFLITDLAALARPDAVQAVIQFEDGATTVSRQFGLANPAIGLAVIQVGESSVRPGLALSSAGLGISPLPVALLGWPWGRGLAATGGRLGTGPGTADLASRLGVEAPAETWDFFTFNGGRFGATSGAPIVDRGGEVIGISLALCGKSGTVNTVIPAAVVRKALLSAKPELKPFSQMPKPLWRGHIVRVIGEPPDSDDFAKMVKETKDALKCKSCLGLGTVVVTGTTRRTCPSCNGEKLACAEPAFEALTQMAAQGAKMVLEPDADLPKRKAATLAAADLLQGVIQADNIFRKAQLRLTERILAKPAVPRGQVLFVQLKEILKAPDGDYALLVTYQSTQRLAVRADALLEACATGSGRKALQDEWILLAGLASAQFDPDTRVGATDTDPAGKKPPAAEEKWEKWKPPPDMDKEEKPAAGTLNAPVSGTPPPPPEPPLKPTPPKAPGPAAGKGVLFVHPFLWLSAADLNKAAREAAKEPAKE